MAKFAIGDAVAKDKDRSGIVVAFSPMLMVNPGTL